MKATLRPCATLVDELALAAVVSALGVMLLCFAFASLAAAAQAAFVQPPVVRLLEDGGERSWMVRRPVPRSFYLHGSHALDFRANLTDDVAFDQYQIDALIVPALYTHPARVYDRRATTLHVVALAPSLATSARQIQAAKALQRLPEWTDPRVELWCVVPAADMSAFGSLRALLGRRRNTRVFSLDQAFALLAANRQVARLYANSVPIPYLARRPLLEHACAASRPDVRDRFGIMFHGDTGRYDNGLRGAVRDVLAWVPNASYVSTYGLRDSLEELHKQHDASLRLMQRSRFCMVPSGDVPSSGRLFEAMAAGCLPILVRPDAQSFDLPFPDLIRWSKLVSWLHPRQLSLEQRHTPAPPLMSLRKEEAALLQRSLERAPLAQLERGQMRCYRVACTVFNPYAHASTLIDYMLDATAAPVRTRIVAIGDDRIVVM